MPEATLVLFTRVHLRLGPQGFGLLLGITALGAVVGGLATGRITDNIGTVRLLVITYAMYGVLLVPVGFTDDAGIVAALFFLQGLPLIACAAAIRSLQQTLVPGDLLGRVGAINRMVDGTVIPLGLAAGGFLAAAPGYSEVWIIAGLGSSAPCC